MQPEAIFSALSLSEVVKQLIIYRPSGLLTIWRALGPRQEEARFVIEEGKPVYVVWKSFQQHTNDTLLTWFNSWGEIHFTFLPTEARMRLPAPTKPPLREQSTGSLPQTTTPLPVVPLSTSGQRTAGLRPRSDEVQAQANNSTGGLTSPPATCVAVLTTSGQAYPAAKLPRYDRTIFLLINGRRTLMDLALLTKRPTTEIYATLQRLQSLRLISISM